MSMNSIRTLREDGDDIYKAVRPDTDRVKVFEKEIDGKTFNMIEVPVSATVEDRDGDKFSEEGLNHLQRELRSGEVPLFLDHGLDENGFPAYRTEDMLGRWVDGEIRDGVLFGTAALEPGNDDAQMLQNKLENDMPVGFSVGFRTINKEERDEGGFLFHETDLMETSAVGIPSNPAAVARSIKTVADNHDFDVSEIVKHLDQSRKDTMSESDDEETREADENPEKDSEPLTRDEMKTLLADHREKLAEQIAESISESLTSEPDETETADEDDEKDAETEEDDEKGAEPEESQDEEPDAEPRGITPGAPDEETESRDSDTPEPSVPGARAVGPWNVIQGDN